MGDFKCFPAGHLCLKHRCVCQTVLHAAFKVMLMPAYLQVGVYCSSMVQFKVASSKLPLLILRVLLAAISCSVKSE